MLILELPRKSIAAMPISGKGMNCMIAAPLQLNHRLRYLAGKDLQSLEEIVVAPNQLVAGRQFNVLVVAALLEDVRVVVKLLSGNPT